MRLSDYSQSGGRGLFRRDRRLFDQRGTFTFTIPDGVTKVWAFAIGAGGGGGTADEDTDGMLGGGKGGGYASGIISGLTPGNTLTLTVGSGGVGGKGLSSAATAGGNTTVVGGSTTYLQGGGGGGASSTVVTSDPGDQKGQGGSASTNSVTDAYTAAGGGDGNWYIDQEADNETPRIVTGGSASGSPFGTGMGGGKSVGLFEASTGGGGWTQRDYEHDSWAVSEADLSSEVSRTSLAMALPGYGSHTPPQFFYIGSSWDYKTTLRGGNGRTAKGKSSLFPAYWNGAVYDDNKSIPIDNLLNFHSYVDGEDGNPFWWFPWELDGGGGAGVKTLTNSSNGSYNSRAWVGGNGGPGAGGGGILQYSSDTSVPAGSSNTAQYDSQMFCIGGNGGFGAGGGSSFLDIYDDNQPHDHVAVGGNGGNGGGGGSARADKTSTENLAIGGNGGDGCIGIYW